MTNPDVTALTEAHARAQVAALHAYRERVQAEAVALARQLNELAALSAEAIDLNNGALPFYAGQHSAFLAARGMCDRLLLVAEESAGEAGKSE